MNDFDNEVRKSKPDGWPQQIKQKLVHADMEWAPNIFHTEPRPRRVHCYFFHSKTERLSALAKYAEPNCELSEIHGDIGKIKATCNVRQQKGNMHHRFRVELLSEECKFNHTVPLYTMKLDRQFMLHTVGEYTP